MVSSARSRTHATPVESAVAWVRARPWAYAYLVLGLWALVPGLRRVVDWKTGFASVSIVSILPLLSLVPAAIALAFVARKRTFAREPAVAAWLWLGAFGYAYAVGIAVGNLASATYTLLGFVLPMFFGFYLMTARVDPAILYERIASFALALSVPISLYAFFQFIAPPPWDVAWMQQTHYVSIGIPEPFSFRPFATLNAPGPFGDFLMGVLVLNLPRFRGANALRWSALVLDIAALALTLVRSNWIGFAVAVLVFVALGPRKLRNLSLIAVAATAFVLIAGNAASLLGSEQAGAELQQRFDSLTEITNDVSFVERQRFFGNALAIAVAQPTGEGLGVFGPAAKLGSAGDTVDFDNGYLARFTEMGYFGLAAYLAAIVAIFAMTARRWWKLERAGDAGGASIAAAALGMQAALVFLDASSDHHAQISGLFFWLAFALVFARGVGPERAR